MWNMTKQDIKDRIKDISFPCNIILYGPERDYRTTYRREHPGYFCNFFAETLENAIELIFESSYEGTFNELCIFSCNNLEEW